ncbi:hypothetical protein [Pedobacter frigidisoli]|uniref:hypothetical protein n=1 Tax=Pedobacter frigidisoli TaxID=2530455 RepID=UPI00292E1726|nr:hypothetical protein [Pedobacter frigidisoli]
MDQPIPPIKERTNKQLLEIVSHPHDWSEIAYKEAKAELKTRNVPETEINHHIYLGQKHTRLEQQKTARESYTILDFIFSPLHTWFEILFSMELRTDGYIRKAEQQAWLRPIFIVVIIMMIIIFS